MGGFYLIKKGLLVSLVMLLAFLPVQMPNASAEEQSQLQEEIVYYILVDRFNNGNFELDEAVDVENPKAYHGGDIPGITDRLNYLQEFGITTIILSPIMKNAPDGYHGYWVEDFYSIDEQFGTMEDLHELIDQAHEHDMKVVLELPINYISETHRIVEDPEKQDWITEVQMEEEGPDWLEKAVQLNHDVPEVQEELINVADFWMNETDIDGFQLHGVDQAAPDFLIALSEHIKEKDPAFYLLGDVFLTSEETEQLAETTAIDAIANEEVHEAMLRVFSEVDQPVSDIYEAWENSSDKDGILYVDDMYSKRFTQLFTENGRNYNTVWSLALTYMYTTPGVPVLFQGSEKAMYGETAEEAQRLVDFNSGDQELQEFHDRISSLKAEFPALSYGDFELVGSSGAMSVFKRTYEEETMFIAINNSSTSEYVPITDLESGLQLRGYLGDNIVRENEKGEYRIGLPRESADVYIIEENQGLNWPLIGFAGAILLLFVLGVIYLTIKEKKREAEGKR